MRLIKKKATVRLGHRSKARLTIWIIYIILDGMVGRLMPSFTVLASSVVGLRWRTSVTPPVPHVRQPQPFNFVSVRFFSRSSREAPTYAWQRKFSATECGRLVYFFRPVLETSRAKSGNVRQWFPREKSPFVALKALR